MSIGVLYESKEWSSFVLKKYIEELGVSCELIDLQEDVKIEEITKHKLIVNRIFASSVFRMHKEALDKMPEIINIIEDKGIPLFNEGKAHFFEIDKRYATEFLHSNNIPAPKILNEPSYPMIIKPNCGGRTTYTFVVRDKETFEGLELPDMDMLMEEYVEPTKGFVTRVEIIGGEIFSVMKRSVTSDGLSAYHLGSKYEHYYDCQGEILESCKNAAKLMGIFCGSMDVIESEGRFAIIDVNSVSNASEDNIEEFGFDLMLEMAKYIVKEYLKE
ncbi:MAG: ATP-grasp domain-containing protein [Anaerovoracaceae bacterium]